MRLEIIPEVLILTVIFSKNLTEYTVPNFWDTKNFDY